MTDHNRTNEHAPTAAQVAPWRSVDSGCEECASVLGLAIATSTDLSATAVLLLARVQNDLIDATADLRARAGESDSPVRLDEGYVQRLDEAAAHFEAELTEPQQTVVLPGGTPAGATLFLAHTVVSRVQHIAVAAGHEINPQVTRYLESLARLLVILGRHANLEHGDTFWEPGQTAGLGDVPLWEHVGPIGVI